LLHNQDSRYFNIIPTLNDLSAVILVRPDRFDVFNEVFACDLSSDYECEIRATYREHLPQQFLAFPGSLCLT
jgi:hypothetical protein